MRGWVYRPPAGPTGHWSVHLSTPHATQLAVKQSVATAMGPVTQSVVTLSRLNRDMIGQGGNRG
jgi:hypothetical protein